MKKIYLFLITGLLALTNCQTTIKDPCPQIPATGSSGSQSTVNSISHNAGQACLNCHNGNTAKKFDVGGTMVYDLFSSEVAPPGTQVSNVGGKNLTVDQCGNFFDTSNPATSTQPSTTKWFMIRKIPNGNCNNSGCHDGSTQSYIY